MEWVKSLVNLVFWPVKKVVRGILWVCNPNTDKLEWLYTRITLAFWISIVLIVLLLNVDWPWMASYFHWWKFAAGVLTYLIAEIVMCFYKNPRDFAADIIGGWLGGAMWIIALVALAVGPYLSDPRVVWVAAFVGTVRIGSYIFFAGLRFHRRAAATANREEH